MKDSKEPKSEIWVPSQPISSTQLDQLHRALGLYSDAMLASEIAHELMTENKSRSEK